MKPLEFMITTFEDKECETTVFEIKFFYEDNTTESIRYIGVIPKGLELNKHYSISDIYGYKVIDDRKGL